MTIQDFLDVDTLKLKRMSEAELRTLASGGRKIANQRISRLVKADATAAPAYQGLPESVRKAGGFRTGKTRAQLMKQIQQEQHFIRGRTSTISGFRQEVKKATEKANEILTGERPGRKPRFGYNEEGEYVRLRSGEKSKMTVTQVGKYFEVLHRVEQDDTMSQILPYVKLRQVVYEVIKANPRAGVDKLTKELYDKLEKEYEASQAERRAAARGIRRGGGRRF